MLDATRMHPSPALQLLVLGVLLQVSRLLADPLVGWAAGAFRERVFRRPETVRTPKASLCVCVRFFGGSHLRRGRETTCLNSGPFHDPPGRAGSLHALLVRHSSRGERTREEADGPVRSEAGSRAY
jgi:hypothetical protein